LVQGPARVIREALQVEVSPQRAFAGDGSGGPAAGALEGDGALGDGAGERAAGLRQFDEPVVQRDDLGPLALQVALDGPRVVHLAHATGRRPISSLS